MLRTSNLDPTAYGQQNEPKLRAIVEEMKSTPAQHLVKGKNKMGNVRTVLDEMSFDSKGEAARYQYLRRYEAMKLIKDLRMQVPIELGVKGSSGRMRKYLADFQYTLVETGEVVTEDFKGHRTAMYILKKAMVAALGIRIREVRRPGSPPGWDESTS